MYDDLNLYLRFRFDRQGIIDLAAMLAPSLTSHTTKGRPIPPVAQVLIALRFYASGSFQAVAGDSVQVSQPTVSRIIHRVSLAVANRLRNFMAYPTAPAEVASIRQQFFEMAGFPGVLGVVDGTQIKIKAPSANEIDYVGRKGGHTINVQGVALPDGSFSNVVAKYAGSAHDARIFRESALFADLVAGRKQGLLIGDSAYALSPFLLKPLPNPTTAPELRYQQALLATRATVECAFGQLKGRWNCLHQELRYSPDRAGAIVVACFALHNYAVMRRLPNIIIPDGGAHADDNNIIVVDNVADVRVHDGQARQMQIIRQYFS
uniref:Putative nuclease HARBI1 n=1 Tax=Plectus sambesii TaxID=2011161 RepID=A0A914WLI2_9BILA